MIQMNPREKKLAIGLAVGVGVWAVWTFAVKPMQERIQTLERILPEKQTQVQALQETGREYIALDNKFKDLRTRLSSQDPAFQLPTFLETMIDRHKLAGHATTTVGAVQPQPDYSESVVTIEMQDVTLKQLLDFLAAVQTPKAVVQIGSLHIRKDPTNDALLDSTIAIHNPRLTGPSTQVAQAP